MEVWTHRQGMSEIKHTMHHPGHPSFGFIDILPCWKGQNVTRGGGTLTLESTMSQEMINGWSASTSRQSLTRTKVLVTGERRPESGAGLNINTPAPPQRPSDHLDREIFGSEFH